MDIGDCVRMQKARRAWVVVGLTLACSFASPAATPAGPFYSLTPIRGLPGSSSSQATDLNNRGQVIGDSNTGDPDGPSRPFLYSDGQTSPLGSATGSAVRINERGDVLVNSNDPQFGPSIVSGGSQRTLRESPGERLFVRDINDSGAYVGSYQYNERSAWGYPSVANLPFIQDGDGRRNTMHSIFADAIQVNNHGHTITRHFQNQPDTNYLGDGRSLREVYYNGNARTYVVVGGLNDADQVVGTARISEPSQPGDPTLHHAFSWKDGKSQDLGTLGGASSFGLGINNSGDIVGTSDILADATSPTFPFSTSGPIPWTSSAVGEPVQHAFLYRDGKMFDLNAMILPDLNWQLVQATRINDLGQIVGWGINPDGQKEGFLLTPDAGTTTAAPVPEPTALALFGLAGVTLWLRRCRRMSPR